MKSRIKSIMNEEHAGYAITLEVMAALFMICIFLSATLYILRVMDVQRYMNTVMTSTAAQAARWGGGDSKAYRDNVSSIPLKQTAQEQLNYVAGDPRDPYGFQARITISHDKISYNGQLITVEISYHLPSAFNTLSKVNSLNNSYDMIEKTRDMKMKVSVGSIMEAGRLL